jgi:hypothetical protein
MRRLRIGREELKKEVMGHVGQHLGPIRTLPEEKGEEKKSNERWTALKEEL